MFLSCTAIVQQNLDEALKTAACYSRQKLFDGPWHKKDFICLNLTTSSSLLKPECRRSACQANNFLFAPSVFVREYLNNSMGWLMKTLTNIIGRNGANFNLQGFDTEKCFSAPADSVTVLSYRKMSFWELTGPSSATMKLRVPHCQPSDITRWRKPLHDAAVLTLKHV